ncbi:MAG: DUF4268 domain-containing protein [Pirellulaceae bacterium]
MAKGGLVAPTKAHPQSFYDMSLGKTGIWISAFVTQRESRIGVSLVFGGTEAKSNYAAIERQKDALAEVYGDDATRLSWEPRPDNKQSCVRIEKEIEDLTNRSTWSDLIDWLYDQVQNMHRTFSEPAKQLRS